MGEVMYKRMGRRKRVRDKMMKYRGVQRKVQTKQT